MKSGSIVFSVNADDSKAQEKLDSLKEKIKDIEKEIEEKRTARNAIAEDLSAAKERAEAARKEVEQLRVAMQESKAITDQAGSRMNAQQFKEYIGQLDKQRKSARNWQSKNKSQRKMRTLFQSWLFRMNKRCPPSKNPRKN